MALFGHGIVSLAFHANVDLVVSHTSVLDLGLVVNVTNMNQPQKIVVKI